MKKRWYERLPGRPSRLALRIYLIGLVQFVVVALVMEIDHRTHERPRAPPSSIEGPPPPPGGPPAFGTSPPGAPRFGPPRRGTPPGPPVRLLALAVLVVVGVSSWLTARSITQPLAALSRATRAFGRGELTARSKMRRADEIGEVAGAFDDMADRIAELLLAERELLANVSHELRTPLARIRVALDLASEADPALAVASLAEVAQDLAELERIVDDIFASARLARHQPSSGALPIRAEPLDATSVLEKSIDRFRATHPERPIQVELADGLPTVVGDPVLLRRLVDNLLDNAHKYTDRVDAPVVVAARAVDGMLVVDVSDEGIGISEEDQERLFEPFFRVDRSRTRATGGIGLGLLLARRVAEAHGGTLTIESELGRGTRARVCLPVAPSRD